MGTSSVPLLPVRMLNEHAYCPRLFFLEWLEGQWADSADTVRGRAVHERVDDEGGTLPEPGQSPECPTVARSVHLGSRSLGLVARIDLVEAQGDLVRPVDYKKGSPGPNGPWEPERIQIAAQCMLLREHGYRCDGGLLYFAETRRRVEVPLTDELISSVLRHRDEALRLVQAGLRPEPLVDSPKCPRCSLVGICLPDEQNLLTGRAPAVRPLVPPRDDGLPLYVQHQWGRLGRSGDEIVVKGRGEVVGRARLEEVSRIVLMGNVGVTTPLLRELAARDIPVAWHSFGGWYYGTFMPLHGRNVFMRIAQHRAASDPGSALRLARAFVHSKVYNQRVLLRRNGGPEAGGAVLRMKELSEDVPRAQDMDALRGIEGAAAAFYFGQFHRMIRTELREAFDFQGRNRRPPRDPVNALLSFAYACLARELTTIAAHVGLDAWVGFLHAPRFGRPSLALDLMEEFRPVIADSVVINALNNGVVRPGDFVVRSTGVAMTDSCRRRFIQVYERRLDELATHPLFGTRLSYRRIIELQVRMLGRVLTGELDSFPEYHVR